MKNHNTNPVTIPKTFWGYNFYVFRRVDGCWVVKATTSYAGEKITATAKCHPKDNFVYEIGRNLAWARCEEKIAYKKCVKAGKWFENAELAIVRANKQYDKAERNLNKYIENYNLMKDFVKKQEDTWN